MVRAQKRYVVQLEVKHHGEFEYSTMPILTTPSAARERSSMMRIHCAAAIAFLSVVQGFHSPALPSRFAQHQQRQKSATHHWRQLDTGLSDKNVDESENAPSQHSDGIDAKNSVGKFASLFQPRKSIRFGISVALTTAVFLGAGGGGGGLFRVKAAHASAPVMALPKAEERDPMSEALGAHERKMAAETQRELTAMAQTARKIEAEQGEAARVRYEREYKEAQLARAQAKKVELEQLKRSLLDEGICPFTDLEGQRQVVAMERGVDLSKVSGTPFYLEKVWESKSPAKSMKVKKAMNRRVVACMVQDMKNRDIDPLDYFQKHQDQTEAILDMKVEQAVRLVQQYEANLEQYGQITVPKEGEMSAKEKMTTLKSTDKGAIRAAKVEARREKAAAREEKARLKAEAKEDAKAAKEEAKRSKELRKQEAAGAAAGMAAVGAAAAVPDEAGRVTEYLAPSQPQATIERVADRGGEDDDENVAVEPGAAKESKSQSSSTRKNRSVVPKALAAIAVAGGGGFAIKVYRDKVAADEKERRRQLSLLMGGTKTKKASTGTAAAAALDEIDVDLTNFPAENVATKASVPQAIEETPAKKMRLGIKSVFGKKRSERETNLMALVASDAKAPEFSTTLAKLLTYGAPGRFPAVVTLPGSMPLETFEIEAARQMLVEGQSKAGLTLEESAEVFANVVNCMLIEIVDLASASLKGKDDKIIIDGISIVVDFMNHAASLYTSIADGVIIKPVTYGGDLSKSKLEQMYSTYASSAMMNMGENAADDFDARESLLRDVFQINDKKAEGLKSKAIQKMMMEMMKDGKGLEGMEEMLKGMGGMEGLAGMDGLAGMEGLAGLGDADGEGPTPEQLKEMLMALKEMKDSGSIPTEEFEQVKKQFNEAFGSSIDDVVKEADTNEADLNQTDKELLQLMKSIMSD